jgi:hypothetical protein
MRMKRRLLRQRGSKTDVLFDFQTAFSSPLPGPLHLAWLGWADRGIPYPSI